MTTFTPRFRPNRRSLLKATGAAFLGVSLLPRSAFSQEEKQINFYNWDTYIGETTLDDFAAATGIQVKMDLYGDNDELFAKLRAGNPGYDVIVPTNDTLERMILGGMVVPLDHSKIPNMVNIAEPFRDAPFDPGRKYSIPYMWARSASATASRRPRARTCRAGRSCSIPTSSPAASRCSATPRT